MPAPSTLALVTGGMSGIGRSTVEAMRRSGTTVVVWDVIDGADVHCDVSDVESIRSAMATTVDRWGVPDTAVLVAGVGSRGRIADVTTEEWDRVHAVNVRGLFFSLQAVTGAMTQAGREGAVVVVSSINANLADPGLTTYSSSKAAVNQIVRSAAVELGPAGIRINAVAPGPTATPMLADATADPAYVELISQVTPLSRIGAPEDVAETIVALLALPWTTGQVLSADGGSALVTSKGWRAMRA